MLCLLPKNWCLADKAAEKKGINLPAEILKNRLSEKVRKRSFSRRLEEQIIEDMFGKDKKDKE